MSICILQGVYVCVSDKGVESGAAPHWSEACESWQREHRQSQTAAHTYLGGYLIKSGLQEYWINKDQINK